MKTLEQEVVDKTIYFAAKGCFFVIEYSKSTPYNWPS